MHKKIYPVILCGGSGTRLWPISKKSTPKQFNKLTGDKSLFQNTIERLSNSKFEKPIISCNKSHKDIVIEQSGGNYSKVYIEENGKNTCPAIIAACSDLNDNDIVVVMPSDHLIIKHKSFLKEVEKAIELAQKSDFVTFGIVPTSAHTGYGYIEHERNNVISFKEKPDHSTALSFLKKGNYLWNSGIFVFAVKTLRHAVQSIIPNVSNNINDAILRGNKIDNFIHLDKGSFAKCLNISFDCAIMEKVKNIKVISSNFGWSDVGDFNTLYDMSPKDKNSNVIMGDIIAHNCEGNYFSTDKNLVVGIGVKDLIIISNENVTMVANKENVQDIKKIVQQMQAS